MNCPAIPVTENGIKLSSITLTGSEVWLFSVDGGMRKGELAALKWDRVSFDEETITISRTRDNYELKDRAKTNLIRVIPMNEMVKATILAIFKNVKDCDYVFLKPNSDEPINPHHLSRDFGQAQRKAGIKNVIRFHDLRHAFASQFVISRGSIYDLQRLLVDLVWEA